MTRTSRPPPIVLSNHDTLQTFEVDGVGILAPETVTEKTPVNYVDIAPFGLSHKRQQYGGTGNRTITPLVFRVVVVTTRDMERSRVFLRFCQSFAYASGSTEARATGPPLMLIVWPRVLSGLFRLREITIQRTRFNKEGEMIEGVVSINASEYFERRTTHEDILEQGSFRIRLI